MGVGEEGDARLCVEVGRDREWGSAGNHRAPYPFPRPSRDLRMRLDLSPVFPAYESVRHDLALLCAFQTK